MARKPRNEELNFLYFDMEDTKETSKEENKAKKLKGEKKTNKRADNKKSAPIEDDKFNFDNEIVIGVTRIPEPKGKNNKQKSKAVKSKTVKSNNKNGQAKQQVKKQINNKKPVPKKKSKVVTAIKWTFLVGALVTAFILFLLSPVFNVSNIEVQNASKISAETYISLSEIQIGENTFKISKSKVIRNIKQNPYVESVEVIRKLPNVIQLEIEERKATFVIEYANSYIYINNQGYILEISEQKPELPIIRSIKTTEEQLKPGNRLADEDLEKMGSVLKIMEAANSVSIAQYITYIDIADKNNYVLRLEEKKKTIYLGDDSNLSNKMLYSKAIIEKEEGIEGNIQAANSEKGNVVFQFKE